MYEFWLSRVGYTLSNINNTWILVIYFVRNKFYINSKTSFSFFPK